MKRILLISCAVLAACNPIELKNFKRPFACDHNGGDGGIQCAAGWQCGFDDRCFEVALVLDGGQHPDEWRCDFDKHCPSGWHCGAEVASVRYCQQLGVGAPSQCLADGGGCEGGWQCGLLPQRCFDPSFKDGGTERDCTVDRHCPIDHRCGELVKDRGQHCIVLDAGANNDCLSDRGCEGGNRCDIYQHRCATVTDVITVGNTSMLGARELSPRRHEDPPVMFAMTRVSPIPVGFSGNTPTTKEGVLAASVFSDGGIRVAAQYSDDLKEDGGTAVLFERTYPLRVPVSDIVELALSAQGPAVRYRDGTAARLLLDSGAWQLLLGGRTDLLRQRDSLDPMAPAALVQIVGNEAIIDGVGTITFPGPVNELVSFRGTHYAVTDGGLFLATDDAGITEIRSMNNAPLALPVPSRGVAAGFALASQGPPVPLLGILAEVPRMGPGSGTGIAAITQSPMAWDGTPPFSACPDGGSPAQLSIGVDDANKHLPITRCATGTGSTFPVQVKSPTEYLGLIEDQTPFQWSVVPQHAGPFVRAHAGADGRFWHALDPAGRGLLGRLPLRPVLLDRQPETMISLYDDGRLRVFAEADGNIFMGDPGGGFVSQLKPPPVNPISTIANRGWIIATTGLLRTDLGPPRVIATIAGGQQFTAPATGVNVKLQLGASLRDVVLVASGDTIWFADVTDAQSGVFAQPAVFSPVLVPVPGVPLRSMTVEPASAGTIQGFLTTNTENLRFGTDDLVRWSQSAVPTPPELASRPLEVWAEADGGKGRTGFTDGRIWSLPIMVQLSAPLPARDGGGLYATDFARKCGDAFVATAEGLFRAERSADGGLPGWVPVALSTPLDSTESLRLFETHDDVDRLFVGTRTGQIVEVTGPCRPP